MIDRESAIALSFHLAWPPRSGPKPILWLLNPVSPHFGALSATKAVERGRYRLPHDAQCLWNAFETIHNKAGFATTLEIPMESFTRAVEIVLKESGPRDTSGYRPPPELWTRAVRDSGYVQARMATSRFVSGLPDAA